MEKLEKETAIQNEQQLNDKTEIAKELHEMNKTLKEMYNMILHICQYGILIKGI